MTISLGHNPDSLHAKEEVHTEEVHAKKESLATEVRIL